VIRLTLWRGKVDDVAVGLEHVHFLNGLNGLNVHFLQDSLKLLVIGAGALVNLLDLSSRGAFASVTACTSESTRSMSVRSSSRAWRCRWEEGSAETQSDRDGVVVEKLLTLRVGQLSSGRVQNERADAAPESHTNAH